MTKKVLISLDELLRLVSRVDEVPEGSSLYNERISKWFHAQPDWLNWIQNAARLMAQDDETIKSLLSKMETTGDKDGN